MTSARFIERAAERANAVPLWHESSLQLVHALQCERTLGGEKDGVQMMRVVDGTFVPNGKNVPNLSSVSAAKCRRQKKRQRKEEEGREDHERDSRGGGARKRRRQQETKALRALLATKNYEVNKLESYSEVKYHLVMEAQRRKLVGERVITARGVVANAILFVVLAYGLDCGLVSTKEEQRWVSWRCLDNEFAWMFEALLKRLNTEDGTRNWGMLTAKFGSRGLAMDAR